MSNKQNNDGKSYAKYVMCLSYQICCQAMSSTINGDLFRKYIGGSEVVYGEIVVLWLVTLLQWKTESHMKCPRTSVSFMNCH